MKPDKCGNCPLGPITWTRCKMIDSMDGTGIPAPGPECPYVLLAAKEAELARLRTKVADLTNDIQSRDFQLDALRAELSRLWEENEKYSAGMQENCGLRTELARLREFIRNGVEYGYIKVPDYPDPARDTIDAIINPGAVEGDES